jgi:hypothetical protein
MSIAPIDSGGSRGGFNRIISYVSNDYNRQYSFEMTENQTDTSSTTINRTYNNAHDTAWLKTFHRLDRLLSGSFVYLFYRMIDITLLSIGLLSTASTCNIPHSLTAISICLLVFYAIDLAIICFFFIRNLCSQHDQLTEEQQLQRVRHASNCRSFFIVFKFIPICIGTVYVFTNSVLLPLNCELTRFCLGLTCMSTWLLILIPPTKPQLPVRRSLMLESIVLVLVLIFNLTYIGTVATAVRNVTHVTCFSKGITSLYSAAPLKSYAYAGLILFAFITLVHLMNILINQLCLRSTTRRRQLHLNYSLLQYLWNYFSTIVVIYYFSLGALLLFQPRSGQPCREDAPNLYQVLLIWQWIRILAPLMAIPLLVLFYCVGIWLGFILSSCLPASITVPFLASLRVGIKTFVL